MEQLRDDPYYLIDDTPKRAAVDVDAIPIVRLEDMPSVSGVFNSLLPASKVTSTSKRFEQSTIP